MFIPYSPHRIKSLINQSQISIIGKNLFNHMKASKLNQSKVSIEFKNPSTHLISMHIDLDTLLIS